MSWIILTFLLVLSILFTIVNKAFGEPMHGRYDPRESHYYEGGGQRDSRATMTMPVPQTAQAPREGLRRFTPW
jgi:hypothetical protein